MALVAARRVLGFVALSAIVRRSAFLDVGGFDPRLGVGGEEQLLAVDLAARAGLREALRRGRWALAERRAVPARLEAELRRLDG